MELTVRWCRALLRQLLRLNFVSIVSFCLSLSVSLLLLLLLLQRQYQPDESSDLAAASSIDTIARQLRSDQGELASISQHVFSAFYDTRSSLNGRKFVRVISVLDTKAYKGDFVCQFMHHNGRFSFGTVARKSKIGAGMSHNGHYYQEFVLSCPIVDDLKSATFLFVQTDDARLRSQVMRVRHNPLSLGEAPAYSELIINCVSVTFGRPDEHRLIEWLEAQRLMRMNKVQVNLHHLLNTAFEAIAQSYSAEGLLNVRRIGCPFCEVGHEDRLGLLLMSPAINHCFYENLGRYKFTAVFDLDEIIVPQQHPDYPSLLSSLESKANTSSFAFRNWYHFTELGEDSSVPNKRLFMLRHPYRTKDASPEGYSTKSIHRSHSVVALHNHFSWEDAPNPGTLSRYYHVPLNLGVLEHYKKCHFDKAKCKKMTSVKDRVDGSRLNKLMGTELTAAYRLKAEQLIP